MRIGVAVGNLPMSKGPNGIDRMGFHGGSRKASTTPYEHLVACNSFHGGSRKASTTPYDKIPFTTSPCTLVRRRLIPLW